MDKFTEVANKITTIKTGLAEAVTSKGVTTDASSPFEEIKTNIESIPQNGGVVSTNPFEGVLEVVEDNNGNKFLKLMSKEHHVYFGVNNNEVKDGVISFLYDDKGIFRPFSQIEYGGSGYGYFSDHGIKLMRTNAQNLNYGSAAINYTVSYNSDWHNLYSGQSGEPHISEDGLYTIDWNGDLYYKAAGTTYKAAREYRVFTDTFKTPKEVKAAEEARTYELAKYPFLENLSDGFRADIDRYIEDKVNAILAAREARG